MTCVSHRVVDTLSRHANAAKAKSWVMFAMQQKAIRLLKHFIRLVVDTVESQRVAETY